INSSEWSPTHADPQRDYLNWWYSHLPHFAGKAPDGFLNNWWRYLTDIDQFKSGTAGNLAASAGVAEVWTPEPAPGSHVGGRVTRRAEAVSDGALGRVDFYVDGQYIGTDTVAPYSVVWNTSGWSPGTHTIIARAYELQQQSEFQADPVTVTIPGVPTFNWSVA